MQIILQYLYFVVRLGVLSSLFKGAVLSCLGEKENDHMINYRLKINSTLARCQGLLT